ncbi:La protein 1 [Tanacetum coccineum]
MVAVQLDDETVKKVIRQVEFYFSDSNIPRDTFLRNTINESEDGSHLGLGEVKADDVPEDTVEAVAETIKAKSTTLKISEDGQKRLRDHRAPETRGRKEFDEQRALDEEAESTRRETLANRKNGSQEEEQICESIPESDEAEEDNKKNNTENKKTSADMYKDNKDVVLREDLKSIFQKFGTVKYIDFKRGGIRIHRGDAEKEYWTMLRGQEKSRGNNKGNWSRGGKNNNRGGRQFNGKPNRSRDNNSGGRPNKFQKVAAA